MTSPTLSLAGAVLAAVVAASCAPAPAPVAPSQRAALVLPEVPPPAPGEFGHYVVNEFVVDPGTYSVQPGYFHLRYVLLDGEGEPAVLSKRVDVRADAGQTVIVRSPTFELEPRTGRVVIGAVLGAVALAVASGGIYVLATNDRTKSFSGIGDIWGGFLIAGSAGFAGGAVGLLYNGLLPRIKMHGAYPAGEPWVDATE